MKKIYFIALLLLASTTSCNFISQWGKSKADFPCVEVAASLETTPMDTPGDSADDPAIWVHPTDASKSLIITTNKKAGLVVYDLQGHEKQFISDGRVNNVDTRYGFPLGDKKVDIVAASNLSYNAISIYAVDPDSGILYNVAARTIISKLDEVYGFCLYRSVSTGVFYAFMNSKNGETEQWELFATPENAIDARLIRSFDVGLQVEGCVADDEHGYLYIGEETFGIWKYFADPEISQERKLVADTTAPYMSRDIEGLTIYYAADGKGYLLVSIQGLNTYAVYERNGRNEFVGCFSIADGETTDGVNDTDGIGVINLALGENFPFGFFIAQDGRNTENGRDTTQNFKIVPWQLIANAFDEKLMMDNTFDIRKLHN